MIGKINDKSSYPPSFRINETLVTDRTQVAEGLIIIFLKLFKKPVKMFPTLIKTFKISCLNPLSTACLLSQSSNLKCYAIANKLKSKLSHGHDDISTKLLKNTITNILQPITHIINLSFNTGLVPQEMKIAKVIPIHKSADQSLLKNYRPVSLIPAFSKLLEKIMYKKIMSHLNSNNIIFKHRISNKTLNSTPHYTPS